MDAELTRTIGSAARAARLARQLTQEDAADLIGVSPEFYARIERGRTLPSVPTLVRIASALQVSADALLGLDRARPAIRSASAAKLAKGDASTGKLLRRLARARPSTVRLVSLLLHEVERTR